MSYTYNRVLSGVSIDDEGARIRTALSEKGFGMLTGNGVLRHFENDVEISEMWRAAAEAA